MNPPSSQAAATATLDATDRAGLRDALVPLVLQAGQAVMAVYGTDFAVNDKADQSPVTEADRRAEAILTVGLRRLTPHVPVVGEEAVAEGRAPALPGPGAGPVRYWLVDPVDGTREFVSRNGEFTVNVALIEDGQPVLGLVLAPALGQLYAGGPGLGAWLAQGPLAVATDPAWARRRPLACRPVPPEGLTVLASRSHGDEAALQAFLRGRRVAAVRHAGSSLKLCLIAAGQADVYPRLGPTMAWDIAAGHAVLLGAGGRIDAWPGGSPLAYPVPNPAPEGRPWENPHFVAWGAI
jgi:3'(2'), 5'-bisphosphate nucleotidase